MTYLLILCIEEGFDAVLQYCDALQELQRRDDAADALAARYKNTYSNQNADVLASSAELMHMTYMQMQKHTEKRKNQTLLLIEPFFNQLDEADKLYLCESIAVLPTNQTNATDGTASIVQTPNGTVLKEGWYDDYYITTSSGFSDDGIVKSVGSTIMVTSKWGEYGLYEHTIYDCPYAGNRTTYSYWSLA